MFRKKLCVAFIAFLLLHETVQGKKSRKNKRPKPEEDYTPQPSVVSYSTFGFNDVGTYEGFVPSSPDYAKLLTVGNQESSSKVQSSGFPTSPESNDFDHSFNSQPYSSQSFSMSEDGGSQASLVQYPQSSINLFNTPSFDISGDQHRNIATEEIYGRNTKDVNAPTYGTKINARNKMRPMNQYNNTDFSGPSGFGQNEEKFPKFHDTKPTFENSPFQEPKLAFENIPSNIESSNSFFNTPSYPSASSSDFNKPESSDTQNPLKFQRVVDFTKLKQYYPSDLDTSRLPTATPIPDVYENNESAPNVFTNTYNANTSNKHFFTPVKQKESYEQNNNDNIFDINAFKASNYKNSNNFSGYSSGKDNLLISNAGAENKKKTKTKPWSSGGHYFKKWKEPSPAKGYEYSTNYSSMSFSYDTDENKIAKPFGSSIDELIPASSNLDVPNYQFPESDFSNFKKMPEYKVHEEDEFDNFPSFKETSKPNEFDYNQYKYLYSTPPTTTSYWGNAFKSSDFSSIKNHPISTKYKYRDEEVVNIPRRPYKLNYEKPYESKSHEWSQYNRRPHKSRPYKDWSNEVSTTRFKAEEDLLGLRNQDTSHPSYLPSYHSSSFASEEGEYKKLVDKWRQSYLKSKFKDSLRDYESYGTETKSMHVPVPKPYPEDFGNKSTHDMAFRNRRGGHSHRRRFQRSIQPIMNLQIEVPHPVIVPVPQPYPVRVPIAKPVAVPVIRELKIPIEKPMPYLVYKDVPYPIEKLVPVPVEKEVPVPVVKPYPVHIPYIRPVFHHTKSRDEYDSDHRDDDDYMPRPDGKNKYLQYKKKIPNGTRNRSRRPSRTAYQDRNRRRWPDRRHPADMREDHPRMRPIEVHHPSPFKRRDSEKIQEESSNYYMRL